MVNVNALRNDIDNIIKEGGDQIRIRYFNISGASSAYDDDVVLTKSGNDVWTSGLIQPIDSQRGSNEAVLVEQGKLLNDDLKLYINGSINTSGAFKIGLGSPIREEYGLATEGGVTAWRVENDIVYKKIYLRRLATGSLMGE
ncbi:MAG: hypothetical protein DRN49_03535 [Thaumarchaeota archaeon]|nr:MAG: hypothetical protein DRN49_03535 [Nitrososphaerota archaeon]